MNASIKLKKITEFGTGTKLATFNVTLESEFINKTIFSMSSTGMSLRVTSEHSTIELIKFCEWLNEASKDESNLRDNESELRIFAKEMIKIDKKMNGVKTL
jgi:hypothetical protein|tara:strand:+ start:33 stop:335 length:303 start_codon:yes stop_codon:yes gene_type:complete